MANKRINELPDFNGSLDQENDYTVVDQFDGTNYKTVRVPVGELGGDSGSDYVVKTGDTMTGPLVVDAEENIEGMIFVDFDNFIVGIEYTSGTIPPDDNYYPPFDAKSTSGNGTNAKFTAIVQSGNVSIFPLDFVTQEPFQGVNYEVGDTVVISGADLGGVDGIDDIVCTITQVESRFFNATTSIGGRFITNGESIFNGGVEMNDNLFLNNNVIRENNLLHQTIDYSSYPIAIDSMVVYKVDPSQYTSFKQFPYSFDFRVDSSDGINNYFTSMTIYDNGKIVFQGNNTSSNKLVFQLMDLSTYADNATAVAGGLPIDTVYKTSTGELRIVI